MGTTFTSRRWIRALSVIVIGLFTFQQCVWAEGAGEELGTPPDDSPLMKPLEDANSEEARLKEIVENMEIIPDVEDKDEAEREEVSEQISNEEYEEWLEKARVYLKESLYPDEFKLAEWDITNKIANFVFVLPDGSRVKISVRTDTAEVLRNRMCEAARRVRSYIAERMGVDILEVHINGLIGFAVLGSTLPGTTPYERHGYIITARVGNYTLMVEYRIYPFGIPGPVEGQPVAIDAQDLDEAFVEADDSLIYEKNAAIILKSFVDNRTGVDYVELALKNVLDLFNPETHSIGIRNWGVKDGLLTLGVDLMYDPRPDAVIAVNSTIPVQVNLRTGELTIDKEIAEAVKLAREQVASNLGIPLDEVHVNSLTKLFIKPLEYFSGSGIAVIMLNITTSQFSIHLSYNAKTGELELGSLINNETGQDLLQNAVKHLLDQYHPEKYDLMRWLRQGDMMLFVFNLGGGSGAGITININTGEPGMSLHWQQIGGHFEEIEAQPKPTLDDGGNIEGPPEAIEAYPIPQVVQGPIKGPVTEIKAQPKPRLVQGSIIKGPFEEAEAQPKPKVIQGIIEGPVDEIEAEPLPTLIMGDIEGPFEEVEVEAVPIPGEVIELESFDIEPTLMKGLKRKILELIRMQMR